MPLTASSALFQLRRFKNSDPPALAEIWNRQQPQRGLVQPVSSALLEQCVFSKQFFAPDGLVVATHEGRPAGFAHASFGPTAAGDALDYSLGTTQMLMAHPEFESPELPRVLLQGSEAYLRSRGAEVIYGGSMRPLNAFYLGLYGGSELSGVLQSDPELNQVFIENGYDVAARAVVLHLELARVRPGVSREQRMLRRETQFEQDYNPPAEDWWEATRLGDIDRQRFRLTPSKANETLASVDFWDIEPLASSWGIRTSGMLSLHVHSEHRRRKMASYLLGEAFKMLRKRGVSLIECHVMADNHAAISLYRGMGFTQVDAGTVYRKPG